MKIVFLIGISFFLTPLYVPYIFAENDFYQATVKFDSLQYFTKEMLPPNPCYGIENTCTYELPEERKKAIVTVTDIDANKFNESIDRIQIKISSDTDPKGITIAAYETHVNSGIFEGQVVISKVNSAQNKILVSDGDSLYAKYIDYTLPEKLKSNSNEISTSAFVGYSSPPVERVPASNVLMIDQSGTSITAVSIGKQVQVVADVVNGMDREQHFAYLVQIQDENDVVVSLSWLEGTLAPRQFMSPSQSWIPQSIGKHHIQIFVWESVENPDALSPPLSLDVDVTAKNNA